MCCGQGKVFGCCVERLMAVVHGKLLRLVLVLVRVSFLVLVFIFLPGFSQLSSPALCCSTRALVTIVSADVLLADRV